jgi:hypothetical protein
MRRVLLCCLLMAFVKPAAAHDPQLSGIRIVIGHGKTGVSVTTHLSRLARAEGKSSFDTKQMDAAIQKRLRLRLDGEPFNGVDATVLRDEANDLVIRQSIQKGEAKEIEVEERLYPDDPSSRMLVTVMRAGEVVQEGFLDAAHPSFPDKGRPTEAAAGVFGRFLNEGVIHIFGGPDHIAFLLGLLLLGGSLGQLLKTVTAFTFAHSITLSLAATGVVTLSPRLVEPVIALSIVAIAFENFRVLRAGAASEDVAKKRDFRPLYAFGFGLIHGFGFAGALAEVGLPQQSLGWALAAFNIGVELGQGAIVLATAPGLGWLQRNRAVWHGHLVAGGSALIGAAGTYWFVTRLLGR